MKLKIFQILLMFMLVSSFSFASDIYTYPTIFTPTNNNVSYSVPVSGMSGVTNVMVGSLCVNITGGTFEYNHCGTYPTITTKILCGTGTDCSTGICDDNKLCGQPVGGGGAFIIEEPKLKNDSDDEIIQPDKELQKQDYFNFLVVGLCLGLIFIILGKKKKRK